MTPLSARSGRTVHPSAGERSGTGQDVAGNGKDVAPQAEVVERVARQALFGTEIARTGVTNPANGARSYSWVMFHGQRVVFNEPEFASPSERDAGTSQAAAYAAKINDAMFDLAKRAAALQLDLDRENKELGAIAADAAPLARPSGQAPTGLGQSRCSTIAGDA